MSPRLTTWGLAAGRNTRRNAGQRKRENQLSPCLTVSSRKLCMGASAFDITINSFFYNKSLEKDCRENQVLSLLASKQWFCYLAGFWLVHRFAQVYPGLRPELLSARAVQINEQIWFGVQVVRGMNAMGGLRENRVGLGWLP